VVLSCRRYLPDHEGHLNNPMHSSQSERWAHFGPSNSSTTRVAKEQHPESVRFVCRLISAQDRQTAGSKFGPRSVAKIPIVGCIVAVWSPAFSRTFVVNWQSKVRETMVSNRPKMGGLDRQERFEVDDPPQPMKVWPRH
jgi:hypothetical protein